jgi:hypothetical protein
MTLDLVSVKAISMRGAADRTGKSPALMRSAAENAERAPTCGTAKGNNGAGAFLRLPHCGCLESERVTPTD